MQAQRSLLPKDNTNTASSLGGIATTTSHGSAVPGAWTTVVGKGAASSGKGQQSALLSVAEVMRRRHVAKAQR